MDTLELYTEGKRAAPTIVAVQPEHTPQYIRHLYLRIAKRYRNLPHLRAICLGVARNAK